MRNHVPPQQLWKEFQGDLDFEYDHDVYWPALIKLCVEKRSEQRARWVKAGKHYGESEVYMRGGDAPSVGSVTGKEAGDVPDNTSEKGKEAEVPVKE